ncbi:Hypothetical protein IALB_2066 [Ignavibacterium album JCM 16511]|uniref:Uncharacterized protein n=1 Tax=Ignavibacterium album (strain DSM 19864 / JCM 16511 / NBRC 101810 / Mat9-16) TaxID=945713 RepID=I0ALB4_IGNAJ|nr:hypothetical protein [Ignavibacterium album]AFH49771.1 Hypothetical protein IALB_2066 [Ignavibacterium album JCM 16511]
MKRKDLIMILFSAIIILLILAYYFLYNIYEIKVEVNPSQLYADVNSKVEIKVIPINALGSKAIFRYTESKFEISEGKELVEVEAINKKISVMKIKSKGIEGKVGIKILSKHSLFPQYVEILILPLKV